MICWFILNFLQNIYSLIIYIVIFPRIGRTGRVGNVGRATSFFDSSNDSEVQGPLVKLLKDSGVEVPGFLTGDDFDGFGSVGGGAPVGMAAGDAGAGGGDEEEW